MQKSSNKILYLIYDGDCILCSNSAQAIRIKKTIGDIQLINARQSHPLVAEARHKGYDLNEGIIVKYNEQYFYGSDAVIFLASIGSDSDLFNRINKILFRYKLTGRLFYPAFKLVRNMLLFFRNTPPIPMLTEKPLIEKIYTEQAKNLPEILQKRYSNRAYSSDNLLLKGELNVTISKIFRLLSPLFRLTGALVPYEGQKITTTVQLVSKDTSKAIIMHRTFYYSDKPPYHFKSKIIHVKDNIIMEVMRFGIGAKLTYRMDKNKIIMEHGGYVLYLCKKLIPIPLGILIGKFYAFEEAVSDDQLNMLVKLTHPLFGIIFQYDGYFKIINPDE